jgi:hypothetical protein
MMPVCREGGNSQKSDEESMSKNNSSEAGDC